MKRSGLAGSGFVRYNQPGMLLALLLILFLLLLLNAFFALAEFAAVKIRSTWLEQLEVEKNPKAPLVRHIHDHVDDYLSVVQVGITFTSIGLGFVGEPAMAKLLTPMMTWAGSLSEGVAHGAAITIGYVLISFLHIVLGELVPKGIAVRAPERAALLTAAPMRLFYYIFHLPRIVLRGAARFVLRMLGVKSQDLKEGMSEEEIRALLGQTQARGLMSLRRLIMVENLFDFGSLKVVQAMRDREQVAFLKAGTGAGEALALFKEKHFSRYPLVDDRNRVVGIIGIKDLMDQLAGGKALGELRLDPRPSLVIQEDAPLESLFAEMQRKRQQAAVVVGPDGRWTGFVTMEDILEEIVGTLGDEYELEKPVFLADLVDPAGILLELSATTLIDAIREVADSAAVTAGSKEKLLEDLLRREREMTTYVGKGLAIPHARVPGLSRAMLLVGRSSAGVQTSLPGEPAHLVFAVITPSASPGEHVRILSRIATLTDSDYVLRRLREASTSAAFLSVLRESDPSVNPV